MEGSQMKVEIQEFVKELRERELIEKKEQAAAAREARRQAIQASKDQVAHNRALQGEVTREEAKHGRSVRLQAESDYAQKAHGSKEVSIALRSKIRAKSREVQQRKKENADIVRANLAADLNFDLAYRGMRSKKDQVRDSYSQRYGTLEDAIEWIGSPLQRLHAWSRWALDGLVSGMNEPSSESPTREQLEQQQQQRERQLELSA